MADVFPKPPWYKRIIIFAFSSMLCSVFFSMALAMPEVFSGGEISDRLLKFIFSELAWAACLFTLVTACWALFAPDWMGRLLKIAANHMFHAMAAFLLVPALTIIGALIYILIVPPF